MMSDPVAFPSCSDLRQAVGAGIQPVLDRRESETWLVRSTDIPAVVSHLREYHQAGVVTVFAEDRRFVEGVYFIYYVLEQKGNSRYLILQAPVTSDPSNGQPEFPSLSAGLPALNWQEREIQDWFGLRAAGHPNPRRVALHDNWPDVHPLQKDFPLATRLPTFEGERHIFRPAVGEGVLQVPVGPVHAGIIEPGHFNFAVAGEPILYLQLRMFYTHKGTEKLFENLPIHKSVFLAESISGDSSFSHGMAFCQAIERAAEIEVPRGALFLRTIFLELERLYNHVADIGAIATDVGYGVANAHAGRLREMLLTLNEQLTGNRLLRGVVWIGGVRNPWQESHQSLLLTTLATFSWEFEELIRLIDSSDSTRDRLEHTGVLWPEKAKDLGIVGVGGRASGIDRDVRRDHPYAAYADLPFHVPVYHSGDVWHRMQVRIDEIRESISLVRRAAEQNVYGPHCAPVHAIPANRSAISAVEGWRGEIIHWIRTAPGNRLERCKIKDPSLNNWPALVEAVQGNIIADFPVINKSFNLSYSGTDR
jgi:Ni,Fe-hydrogenase III large subunit/Ni,Fe-hydrogenase III component G